ncbi:hypothetical protein KBB96_13300 [Luteolibacter ambystomatis]|uniref:Uncharacterized protein n=1 Tax=Luteolibacter ambystomatis TaxID=2824561 RepID=A0A975IZM0_9BACT|nr:hypothetical protein [Luteolibacter ambystomatis]QUE49845.1 hypothetical protein KBB96_13300 [Luteolibacter ambystomatis]
MKTSLFLLLALVGHATADETADKVAEELAAAYKKTGGFIAKYHSESKGRTLDATVALDMTSGLMVSETNILNPEKPADIGRMWNIPGDVVYMQRGDHTFKIEGMLEDLKFLNRFSNAVSYAWTPYDAKAPPSIQDPTLVGGTMLTTEGMTTGFAGSTSDWKPLWWKSVQGGTVQAQSPESVTFQTKDDGLVTIERASGVLLKQSTPNQAGSIRTLSVQGPIILNPGKERVAALSVGWSTATVGVKGSGSLTNTARALQFQDIIAKLERGLIDLGKIEKALEERKGELHQIAIKWAKSGELSRHPRWKAVMDVCKEEARKVWLKQLPDSGKGADEEAFEAFLGSSAFRSQALAEMAKGIAQNEDLRARALDEMFQPRLSASNEAGEAAKTLLEDVLVAAYAEAIMEQKAREYWGERKGLD